MRAIVLALVLCAGVAHAQVQDLGHRIPAGTGMDAGTQIDPGVYAGDLFVMFDAHTLRDRAGNPIPIENLDLDARANVFGAAGTLRAGAMYLTAAVAIPIVSLSLSVDDPRASVDRLGLGNIFLQPIKLGTRLAHADLVTAFSVYAPTSQGERAGVGRPEWSEQLSAGGTAFFDAHRGWRLSALASYLHNERKRGIDIVRGDSVLIQGGAGGPVFRGVGIGVAGYALWQVTDDRGADLPEVMRGARERAFGVGPELELRVPALRSRFDARMTWDLDGRARPVGTIVVVSLSVVAWR